MNDENDENHEHQHAFIFPFPMVDPEEMERARMEQSQNAHDTRDFFDSLTIDQLRKLAGLFRQAANSDGEAATYYMGLIVATLHYKHDLCMACGVNHDEILAGMSGPVEDPQPAREVDEPQYLFPEKGTPAYDKIMATYGMEQDDDGSDRVMCSNCGTWYESLRDRAVRPPGKAECYGCVEKEKWG